MKNFQNIFTDNFSNYTTNKDISNYCDKYRYSLNIEEHIEIIFINESQL